ncbi:MAG: hypothetical protein IPF62_11660 [Bacteroidetes bacterium]|nr:hypothetical protein [Bacteroidota bacterium]
MIIKTNPITLNGYSGVGINLNNTSAFTNAHGNHIGLTNTEGTIICMATSSLNGISATNVKSTQMEQNIINGNANLLLQDREDIAGIQINSTQQALHCNHISPSVWRNSTKVHA